jgi:hypothetical protein
MRADGGRSREIALLAVEIAEGYAAAGIREVGGNNRGDEVEFFLRLVGIGPGEPWCAAFVSACIVKAHARALGLPEDRAALIVQAPAASAALMPLSGLCRALASAARHAGLFRPRGYVPVRGDLALFDFTSPQERLVEPHHVGFVRGVQPNGALATVEGNTTSGESGRQADGDGVYCRVRGRERVYGYVHFR